ncbi:MAG: hypothetical protein HQL18_01015 [Candidatus Omnitrophica bacterium]|nr:hypothetical protein [Candidatus Omnitrophota bacterium]
MKAIVELVQPSGLDIFAMIAGFVFATIGLVAFIKGKKHASWRKMVLGIALMAYPYFVSGALWICLVGLGLCAALYFWRD